MAESQQHKSLVRGLVDWMRTQGVTVTHAVGDLQLPDPPRVGRHEPDALGTKQGVTWIGEAKLGEVDLSSTHSLEQMHDFSHRVMPNTKTPCPFVLCVSKGQDHAASAALGRAGANTDTTAIIL
jgi:hypothetical protein